MNATKKLWLVAVMAMVATILVATMAAAATVLAAI